MLRPITNQEVADLSRGAEIAMMKITADRLNLALVIESIRSDQQIDKKRGSIVVADCGLFHGVFVWILILYRFRRFILGLMCVFLRQPEQICLPIDSDQSKASSVLYSSMCLTAKV